MDTKYGLDRVLRIRATPTDDPAALDPDPLVVEAVPPPDELQAASAAVRQTAVPTAAMRVFRVRPREPDVALFLEMSISKPFWNNHDPTLRQRGLDVRVHLVSK
jgi:hypothetical protein